MRAMSYPELAFDLIRRFADDIPAADLKPSSINLRPAPPTARMKSPAQAPGRRPVYPRAVNGPTLAFKDMAMQLLGNLF